MQDRLFNDRRDAGRVLGGLLERYRGIPGVMVLGLPRGGVPVADETRAVEPLGRTAGWERGEVPELYPFAVEHLGRTP